MILWLDGAHDPVENMRRDALLLAAAEAAADPVLRLFAFDPAGITLGKNQIPERELDLASCARDGIPWATRPTGGRAIFHAEEWTYSIAAPLDHAEWGKDPAHAYQHVSRLLVASLERLGVPAALERGGRTAGPPSPRPPHGPATPCFASTARHEVVLEGRKLVGSAQRRTARGLLQQGSVLLGPGHLRLADYLRVPDPERRSVRDHLARSTRHAGDWLGSKAPLDLWAGALAAELRGAGRVEGSEGLFLLTLEKPGSYTAAFSQAEQ
jgi:lipoate-protein ligase A